MSHNSNTSADIVNRVHLARQIRYYARVTEFVSRAGQKLEHAIAAFAVDVRGWDCADLGCNVGGFVDCLLQRGARHVFAVDTGYGALAWKLRKDPRVTVMERTNAMHAQLPRPVDLVTIDVAWTRQRHILPAAARLLKPAGIVISLIKPHYEAEARDIRGGVLPEDKLDAVLDVVRQQITAAGFAVQAITRSPIKGSKGNIEMLALLTKLSP